ncbi:MAG TPA: hypothetical protein VFY89_03130 [Ktedonobacterales bacterium]
MFNDPNINPDVDAAIGGPLMGQQFMEGAPVYDINGEKVGDVSEHLVQQGRLVIHRGLLNKDVYLPLNTITRNDPTGVYLNIAKDDVKALEHVGPMPESQRRGAMGIDQQPMRADQAMGTPGADVETRDTANRDMPDWPDTEMSDRDMLDRP